MLIILLDENRLYCVGAWVWFPIIRSFLLQHNKHIDYVHCLVGEFSLSEEVSVSQQQVKIFPWFRDNGNNIHECRGVLTHWGRVTHICVGILTIIASDNGLSPGRRQAIIWTNDGILLIGPLGTNFNEILIEIHTFLFKKMHLKMSSAKRRPFCLGLNVLNQRQLGRLSQ